MALDPEELKKRRQQRQEARQQRQKQLRIRLGIAAGAVITGVAVIVCVMMVVALLGKNKAPSESTQPTQTDSATGSTEQTETPVKDAATTVIHLAAAGDLNVTQAVVDAGGPEYDYTGMLLDVAPVLAQADITAVNFEGSLFGTPYGEDRSAPQGLMDSLSAAGVDLIQLANSYSIYKGMDGLSATLEGIRAAGMEPVGAYATADEAKKAKGYTIRNVQGVKIAFVAFTKGMDGMALPPGNENCVNVLYTDYATDYQKVDTEGITQVLDAAARERPDITVALLHWGSEYNDTVSKSQQEICELLQENGVDAIIGTHSHYVQKMEFDEKAGTFVAYSLGDFLGDATWAGAEYSVILDLEITKNNKTGDTKITGFDYTPIFTAVEKDQPLRAVRIDTAIAAYEGGYIDRVSAGNYEAMKYALTRIDARIKGE